MTRKSFLVSSRRLWNARGRTRRSGVPVADAGGSGFSVSSAVTSGPTSLTIETPYSWIVIALTLVITSLSFGAVTSVPILMKPMADDLGWDRASISLAHSLAMVAAGVGGVFIGHLADRRGFALLSAASGVAIGVGLWLSSLAQVPWALYVAFGLFVGVGQGTFFGPITANASHWFDRNRGLAMAISLCGQSIGGLTISVLLREWAAWWGWRDAMLIYGVLSSLLIVACSLVFLRIPPERASAPPAGWSMAGHSLSRHRVFFSAVAMLVPVNMGSFVIIAHLVAFGEEQGLSPGLASSLLATMLGITLFSRLFGGALVDRGHAFHALVTGTIAVCLGTFLIGRSEGDFGLMSTGVLLFGLGYGGLFPAFTGIVRSTFPSSAAGVWVSLMFLFGFVAAALGSWLGGWLRDAGGNYGTAFDCAAALEGLGLFAGIALFRAVAR